MARRAVVAGGGAGGLATAHALTRVGFERVLVVDPGVAPPSRTPSRVAALWSNSIEALQALELWEPLQPHLHAGGATFLDRAGYRAVDGTWLAQLSTTPDPSDYPAVMFVREEALLAGLHVTAPPAVEWSSPGQTVQHFDDSNEGHVEVHLSDGSVTTADLLVGADGLHSTVRGLLADGRGPAVVPRGYVVCRAVLPAQIEPAGFQTWGVGRRFASVPLRDGQAWFATLVPGADGELAWQATDDAARLLAFLRETFAGWHDPVPLMLERTRPEDLLWEHAVALKGGGPDGCSTGRLALVGDAVHCVDPVLAQGVGIAIEDAVDLAAALAAADLGMKAEIEGACQLSERRRRGRMASLRLLSDLSQALGQLPYPALVQARDAVFHSTPGVLKTALVDAGMRFSLADGPATIVTGRPGYTCPTLP